MLPSSIKGDFIELARVLLGRRGHKRVLILNYMEREKSLQIHLFVRVRLAMILGSVFTISNT